MRRKHGGGSHLFGIHRQTACDIVQKATWLRAQATNSFAEVKYLAQQESGIKFVGSVGSGSSGHSTPSGRGRGDAPPERDEQESEWAGVLQGVMKRLRMK